MIDASKLSSGCSVSLIVLGSASSKENRLSGVVFGFDQETNLVLLRSKGVHNGVATWRFIPFASIQNILSSEPTNEASTLPEIDLEAAAKREERATQWVSLLALLWAHAATRTSL